MSDFTESDIITYRDFFKPNDFETVLEYLSRPMWRWGSGSLCDGHPDKPEFNTPFWKMDLTEEYFFTTYLFNIIREKTNQDFYITRCYCNGHLYGTSGLFHEDWDDDRGRTIILYSNDTWKQEWGGKTVFNFNGKYHYNEFIPNSIVIFPGIIPHRAEVTSREFTGLRKTVAWKLILKD